jgi:signal transduction histidine kinase
LNEIAHKSHELEIASQHKSQFVANMSHELRIPLAMLGYAELLRDGMFGELPEKATHIIERVQANGKHLLRLINTVLDISKIESGQFNLNLGEYSLNSMVETVRVATESLASAPRSSPSGPTCQRACRMASATSHASLKCCSIWLAMP